MTSIVSTLRRVFHTVSRIRAEHGVSGVLRATLTEFFPWFAMRLVLEPDLSGIDTNINTMPLFEQPKVTILIPVYNNLELTLRCLSSIKHARTSTPYRVLILNDASTDDTQQVLSKISNIKLLNQETNIGFLKNCNAGFKQVDTQYIALLNNDTLVMDDWLDELVEVFESHSDAGLVGSKLIYPSGLLQEAGGIIWRDASGNNYGKNKNPLHPNFNYVREVDYCSGASILFETEMIKRLHGFDEQYAPAYYEDTDLAFQMHAMGKKVYFNPLSVVVHWEGMTCGQDTSKGIKQSQIINQKKFLDKWQDRLQSMPLNQQQPDLEKQQKDHRTHLLIIDSRIPKPAQDSGSFRMYELLKILIAEGIKVTFMPDNLNGLGAEADNLRRLGVKVPCAPFFSVKSYLKEYGHLYDFVILSKVEVADRNLKLTKRYMPQAKIIFDTVDLAHIRELREAEIQSSQSLRRRANKTKAKELSYIQQSDFCLVVSAVEQGYLERMNVSCPVEVVSNIHCNKPVDTDFDDRQGLLFIGGFGHPPNIDAVHFLVNDIMPLVLQSDPAVKLTIVGSCMPASFHQMASDNIIMAGFVDDLEPLLRSSKMSLAPLRFGAGVKGKVNQSMSYGLPVVATSIAAEGMFLTDQKDVLIADSAEAFSQAIIGLYNDQKLWEKLSENSQANIDNHFSAGSARTALKNILGNDNHP